MVGKKVTKTKKSLCAFCNSSALTNVIKFGNVALAGGFLDKKAISTEKKYPLTVVFCENCYAVQVLEYIDPKVLFATDFYFSSAIKTLREHFTDYAAEVVNQFLPQPKKAVVVEFGSNDGVLLKPLADQGVGTVIGVEPAKNIIDTIKDKRLTIINDFFNTLVASSILQKYGKADLVIANNVYAHIPDINEATRAVQKILADDGVFIFEVHYLGKIVQDMQYDMIYHEHFYYYSLIALENHLKRHDMVIFDLKPIPIHGGSIRYYAAKKTSHHANNISSHVTKLRNQEMKLGYDRAQTYKQFATRVAAKKKKLMTLIMRLKNKGYAIAGYGASGRANTIIQYCGITNNHLDFMIDDGPAKQGLYTPGSHLLIRNNEALKKYKPSYVLLFAWSFFDEIAAKNVDYFKSGGCMIVPLPDVKVIKYSGERQSL